ncbi:MAG: cell division protein SepF [Lachnospiraceae bacterium]|nr:cell division protein SepF [Lachnospiraceae bacterium]
MANESKRSFLDFFKMKDLDDEEDEFEDDLFDDDDEEDYDTSRASSKKTSYNKNYNKPEKNKEPYTRSTGYSTGADKVSQRSTGTQTSTYSGYQKPQTRAQNNNLVDFNSNKQQRANNYRGGSEVYVIKPQEISESQTVADFLNAGKTIVINMEGLELAPAQRIIDFIGGACYAIGGSLQAISANIFIAAPSSIEVSGDLREEILNETTVSPQLGQY